MKSGLRSISAADGFTLIEMMVVVAIIGILAALVAPSVRDAMLNARMTGLTNDTLADLNIARSEAVKRNLAVSLCPSPNGISCSGTNWAVGWIVFSDTTSPASSVPDGVVNGTDEIIKVTPAVANTNPSALLVSAGGASPAFISYGASGAVVAGATPPIVFTFCDVRANTPDGVGRMRQITINTTGRPVHTAWTCAAP